MSKSIVKNELVQYIATAVEKSPLENRAARHDIAALLLEEVIKLATDEDGTLDQYVLKPLYKAQVIALESRIKALRDEVYLFPIDCYKETCQLLERCASDIKLK